MSDHLNEEKGLETGLSALEKKCQEHEEEIELTSTKRLPEQSAWLELCAWWVA